MVPARVLVTGASGFVGRYLCAAIAGRWPQAEILSLTADLRDETAVAAAVADARPDTVFHLAAQASVASSLASFAETWSINAGGSLHLATALARHAPDALVLFASSSEVYGASFLDGVVDETSPLAPLTPYAKSKAAAERLLADVLPATTRLLVARPFNHSGPSQGRNFVLPSFAAQVAEMERGSRPPQLHVGNLDVRRDVLDVRDVVGAYLRLVEAAPRLPLRFVGLVATGTARPLRDLVEKLRAIAKVDFEIVVDPARLRPVDVPSAAGSPALLQSLVDWTPQIPIETTLADLLTSARRELDASTSGAA